VSAIHTGWWGEMRTTLKAHFARSKVLRTRGAAAGRSRIVEENLPDLALEESVFFFFTVFAFVSPEAGPVSSCLQSVFFLFLHLTFLLLFGT
jgi:hypothetical protein